MSAASQLANCVCIAPFGLPCTSALVPPVLYSRCVDAFRLLSQLSCWWWCFLWQVWDPVCCPGVLRGSASVGWGPVYLGAPPTSSEMRQMFSRHWTRHWNKSLVLGVFSVSQKSTKNLMKTNKQKAKTNKHTHTTPCSDCRICFRWISECFDGVKFLIY